VKERETHSSKGLKELLRSAGLKVTPIRMEILNHLGDVGRPMSHAEVQAALPNLDRVTIYRTLASFMEADIVHQVQGFDGTWRFCAHSTDSADCPGNHPHFLCTSCGRMVCLLGQNMPKVDVPDGNVVKGKQLVVYGECGECAAKR
jgi:Fur family ferric uptake transcriptional regulator/Fur family zinc uptake transcriptional regulator